MKFNHWLLTFSAFLSLEYFLLAQDVKAFSILSDSATVDLKSQQVTFKIEFDQVPDFSSIDEYNRAANSFQYYINCDNDGSALDYSLLDLLIRGEEIKIAGEIPIRNAFPGDETDLHSGGWGSVRGTVPFTMNQNIMTFSVPLAMLGETDGHFTYDLETYEYGMMVSSQRDRHSQMIGTPVDAPEPKATLGLIGTTVAGLIASRTFKPRF